MESSDAIMKLIQDFAQQLVAVTRAAAEERLRASLGETFAPSGKRRPGRAARTAASGAKPFAGRRPMTVTPKVARARKLQGQYLGALRGLSQANRARVKAVARAKGVSEALKLAASLKK